MALLQNPQWFFYENFIQIERNLIISHENNTNAFLAYYIKLKTIQIHENLVQIHAFSNIFMKSHRFLGMPFGLII